MSTNVNHRYIGGSSNVNVDKKSFSKDVLCLITLSKTDFTDKKMGSEDWVYLKYMFILIFLALLNNFKYVVINTDNILKKQWKN